MIWTIKIPVPTPSLNEIKEIPGMHGYGASIDGRVFSKRIPLKKDALSDVWREMAYGIVGKGYLRCAMRIAGETKMMSVHRIIVKTFIGDIPSGMQVNHIDGNKQNNSAQNLEIVTGLENMRHAYATGLHVNRHGENHPCCKITEESAIEILRLCRGRLEKQRDIAKRFGITQAAVSLISTGHNWSHL